MSRLSNIPSYGIEHAQPLVAHVVTPGLFAMSAGDVAAAAGADALLLESGDYLLQEDGSSHLLIE